MKGFSYLAASAIISSDEAKSNLKVAKFHRINGDIFFNLSRIFICKDNPLDEEFLHRRDIEFAATLIDNKLRDNSLKPQEENIRPLFNQVITRYPDIFHTLIKSQEVVDEIKNHCQLEA